MPFCSKNSEGKIKTVALTNFDTDRLQIILENGIPVVSNQVYSSYLYMEDLLCLLLYDPKISETWLQFSGSTFYR
jgi:diketogulonate reductase-like aldo/keto reductase